VHGLRCYGNITRTRNVSEYMLVLALCLVRVNYVCYTTKQHYYILDYVRTNWRWVSSFFGCNSKWS